MTDFFWDLILKPTVSENSFLWGTKNESKKPRLLLAFILKDKTGDVSKFEFEGHNKIQIFKGSFFLPILFLSFGSSVWVICFL